ncbi:MAG TPA: UvrD-helicase domain-containing protein [Nevskiaceae bacterium]|nr:UvrD-helicase domain-containing protein [Nevskiaceae bacterium]
MTLQEPTALTLNLDGPRIVEASAGTGKTYTIATLYLRLIVEHGVAADSIVVATFTRAAAAELASRLRERLELAEALLSTPPTSWEKDGDDTQQLLSQLLADGQTQATLLERVGQARASLDTAFIGTLHGFCSRVLTEFGFEARQGLSEPELVTDPAELKLEIVRDFWRQASSDAATAVCLSDTWRTPEALLRQISDARWHGRTIRCPDASALLADVEVARARIAAWTDAQERQLQDELERCMATARARKARLDTIYSVQAWAKAGPVQDIGNLPDEASFKKLERASIAKLKPVNVSPVGTSFDDLDALGTLLRPCWALKASPLKLAAAHWLAQAQPRFAEELERRLTERNLMAPDQAVTRLATALTAHRESVATITKRWTAALIDEFQDTNTEQWQIIEHLFGDRDKCQRLILVGDPKQAIYGFRGGDVYAWLEACEAVQRNFAATPRLTLLSSYRSGAPVCAAVNALFAVPQAFGTSGIDYLPVQSARAARCLVRHGKAQPGLLVWWLDPVTLPHKTTAPSKAAAEPAVERACVDWIAALLADDTAYLQGDDGERHRVQPSDIAILVDTNKQAQALQGALGRCGIPAASNINASVYQTVEAADLTLLLAALAAPDDIQQVRAAAASVLVGGQASTLVATRNGPDQQAALLEAAAHWVQSVQRHGPLSWLLGLLEAATPRLLKLAGGQRRVANYLQLAELLQELARGALSPADLAVAFARTRQATGSDETRLRLDTDADAVTIATIHAAKGLEYNVVLLPYATLGRGPNARHSTQPKLAWYHDAQRQPQVAIGPAIDQAARIRDEQEAHDGDLRKLYVAATRARALCVTAYGPTLGTPHSALFRLLNVAGRAADKVLSNDTAGCRQALQELVARAGDAVAVEDLPASAPELTTPLRESPPPLAARQFTRTHLDRDWRTWSFSRLMRSANPVADLETAPGAGDRGAADAPNSADTASAFGGIGFGLAVHAIFQQTNFAAWRDVESVPDTERALVEQCLRAHGLGGDTPQALTKATEAASACVRDALNTTLPCALRLCELPATQRRAEMEFHLALAPARSGELYELLHRYGYQQPRHGIAPERLHGLLTGQIDLTFVHAGRYHLIDWKTNRCTSYGAAGLQAEIDRHGYDLQWLIYMLALHRWLATQLTNYDYDSHVGELYYLFVRGLHDGTGIRVDHPPRALIEALDVLFRDPAPTARR